MSRCAARGAGASASPAAGSSRTRSPSTSSRAVRPRSRSRMGSAHAVWLSCARQAGAAGGAAGGVLHAELRGEGSSRSPLGAFPAAPMATLRESPARDRLCFTALAGRSSRIPTGETRPRDPGSVVVARRVRRGKLRPAQSPGTTSDAARADRLPLAPRDRALEVAEAGPDPPLAPTESAFGVSVLSRRRASAVTAGTELPER